MTIARRTFLKTVPAAALATHSLFAKAAPMKPATRILFGTGGRGSKGIYTAPWNPATGEIGSITLAIEAGSPSFLATYPNGNEHFVYAVSEAGRGNSKISAFTTVAGSTELKKLNDVAAGGNGPTHISVSADGRAVFCANYGGGSVSSFHVRPDGSLSDVVSNFQFTGSGPYKGRQEKSHVHSANPTPDNKWVLVNDLGLDRINIYKLNSATAEMTPHEPPYWAGKPASGPRHIVFHPNGKWVYSVNELTSTVDILDWDSRTGNLTSKGSVSTLKDGFPPDTAFAGEIVISPNGKQVYAGNRVADDTIAVFDVDPHSGMLKQVQLAANPARNPRHVALDPTGRWMVLSDIGLNGDGANKVVVLERNLKTGLLSEPKHVYDFNQPNFAGFI